MTSRLDSAYYRNGKPYDWARIRSHETGTVLGGKCINREGTQFATIRLGDMWDVRGDLLAFVPAGVEPEEE